MAPDALYYRKGFGEESLHPERKGLMKKSYIPNFITMLRMFGAVALLWAAPLTLPFYLMHAFCGLTDMLDGGLARGLRVQSRLGAQLDSVADLMFYGVMLVKLMPILWMRMPPSLWYVVGAALVIRLGAYGLAAVKQRRFSALHTPLNKFTGLLVFLVPYILALPAAVPLCHGVAGMAVLSSGHELWLHIRTARDSKEA